MAEVTRVGALVALAPTPPEVPVGSAAVYPGTAFPVEGVRRGGMLTGLVANAAGRGAGLPLVVPGVRQGVYVDRTGAPVDFTDWVWKTRVRPWCGLDPPVVRGGTVRVTPDSNDPTGREITLSITWGDGMTTPTCPAGMPISHTYATSGRYTLTVRATNHLGDSAGVSRDVVVVGTPDGTMPWITGGSPGGRAYEHEEDATS